MSTTNVVAAPVSPGPGPRRRRWPWVALAVVGLLLVGGFAIRWAFWRAPATVAVERQTLREVLEITGAVKPARKVTLRSEATGLVGTFLAKENQLIAVGTPLVQMGPQRAQLDLVQAQETAKGAIVQAEGALQNARDTLADEGMRQNNDLVSQGGALDKAIAALARCESDLARGERLLTLGAVTRQSVEESRQQRNTARVDLSIAHQNLARTRSAGSLARAQHAVSQAIASLAHARDSGLVSTRQATENLARTTIRAPFRGVVTSWLAQPGDLLANGAAVATFEDLADLRLVLPVDELDLPKMRAHMPVTIAFDAFPGTPMAGQVARISRSSTVGAENVEVFPIEVAFANPGDRVKPGMNGDVSFVVREKKDVLTVPAQAVLRIEGKTMVMRLAAGARRPERVVIETGLATVERYEVLSGLAEGDRLLANPPAPKEAGK